MRQTLGRSSGRLRGLAGALALAAALVAGGCAEWPVDEAGARRVAEDWVARQAPPGLAMANVTVSSVQREGGGWVVEATGEPRAPGEADGLAYYYILFIDGTTGEVTIRGQG